MRRPYKQLILEIYALFKAKPTKCYSTNEISRESNTTWRTSRNVLDLLKQLNLIKRIVMKKRELWLLHNRGNVKDEV
jgi:predicted transcriptional regulator